MQEQMAELQRQARVKMLAAEADARWEAKPSLLHMPQDKTAGTTAQGKGGGRLPDGAGTRTESKIENSPAEQTSPRTDPEAKPSDPDPWKRAERGAPGESWQPEAWTPTSTKKR